MNSFYVDIKKCRPAGADLDDCQTHLQAANKRFEEAISAVSSMGSQLASVGASATSIKYDLLAELSEVAQLYNTLQSILRIYYNQEMKLLGNRIINNVIEAKETEIDVYNAMTKVSPLAIFCMYNIQDFIANTEYGQMIKDYLLDYQQHMNECIQNDFGNAFDIGSIIKDIVLSENGKFAELIWSLLDGSSVSELNVGDYFKDLFEPGEFEIKEFIKETIDEWRISDVKPNNSIGGTVLNWIGKAANGFDVIGTVQDNFLDIIYNEETGHCEWNLQNIGYFFTDTLIDSILSLGYDMTGSVASKVVAGIPGVGPFLAPVADAVTSCCLEWSLNMDLPVMVEGEYVSIVDLLKLGNRQSVDNILVVGDEINNKLQEYMETNHPKLTSAIVNELEPTCNTIERLFDYSAEQLDYRINFCLSADEFVSDFMEDTINSKFQFAKEVTPDLINHFVKEPINNNCDLIDGIIEGNPVEAIDDFVHNSIESNYELGREIHDAYLDSSREFGCNLKENLDTNLANAVEQLDEYCDNKIDVKAMLGIIRW